MAVFHYLFIMSLFISAVKSQGDVQIHKCRDPLNKTRVNITAADIDTLVNTLVNKTIQKGFIVTSQGKFKSKALYGLAQCRGDDSAQDCENCIRGVAGDIRSICPDSLDAKLWYDHCLLRYNTRNFIGKVDTTGHYMANHEDASDPVAFNRTLGGLMGRVKAQAVNGSGGKRGGFGIGQAKVSPTDTVYGVAQCTRDLSHADCAECLRVAYTVFESLSCKNKKGCRVFYGSCYVRYELYPI